MEPYIPFFKRSPNKFIQYDDRPFDYGWGWGIQRIAVFRDKNGKTQEAIAQVIWRRHPCINGGEPIQQESEFFEMRVIPVADGCRNGSR